MPRTKITPPNHPAASPPRARLGRSATKTVKERAKQGKIAKSRQRRSDHVTGEPSKQQLCLELLSRRDGASIDELQTATGWQPHSVRGFLSGTVKKKLGLTLGSDRPSDGPRRYRVGPEMPV